MKAKILLLSIILVVAFSSCEKSGDEISIINGQDELLIPSTATLVEEKSTSISDVQEIAEAEEFAKLLAMSLNDKELRKFLKNEANKMFDGDYDILVSNILESKIAGLSFKEKVAKNSSFGKSKGHEVISSALKNEKLNISIPFGSFKPSANVDFEPLALITVTLPSPLLPNSPISVTNIRPSGWAIEDSGIFKPVTVPSAVAVAGALASALPSP